MIHSLRRIKPIRFGTDLGVRVSCHQNAEDRVTVDASLRAEIVEHWVCLIALRFMVSMIREVVSLRDKDFQK